MMAAKQAYQPDGILPKMPSLNPNSNLPLRFTSLCAVLAALLVCAPATANCDGFIRWSAENLDSYQANHRLHLVSPDLQPLASENLPGLWVHPDSYSPIDFRAYLNQAQLHAITDNSVLAKGDAIRPALSALTREERCTTYPTSPEQSAAQSAPVCVQWYQDHGPDGSPNWLYLKYTWVFDWSGLAEQRGWLSRTGALLAGGRTDRWHRLDSHASALLGLDAGRQVRTLTLQQRNNKRTYVAGWDFPPGEPLHLAAAISIDELYLDTGTPTPQQRRRAVATFLQWAHLIDAKQKTMMLKRDESVGRSAEGIGINQHPVFPGPEYPLAAYAGLLAPKRRMLGLSVGRDGPPGYDFDGIAELPDTTVIGFWRQGDTEFLPVLEQHLHGFSDTNWEAIANYLRPKSSEALDRAGGRPGLE